MSDFNYQLIDGLIHSRIRLSIMAVLVSVDEAEFTFLKRKVNTTDGNLSVHLKKLEEAGYIFSNKQFVDKKPVSAYKISNKGHKAFKAYVQHLENIIK